MGNTNNTKHPYNTLILRILIGFLIVFAILFGVQWYCLNKAIKEGNDKRIEVLNSLKDAKTNLIDVSHLPNDSINIVLNKKDIEEINSSLNSLATEIYSEKNRAESIIDKDIDRLNLYMAIGIGFIAILGVFVPFLVNVLSNEDLKRKQEIIANKIELNDRKIDEAIKKSAEIDDLKGKTEELLPKITVVSFQIAIHRLFTVSPLAISEISRTSDNSLFKELFENVKIELGTCSKNITLVIEENVGMQQTLKDFSKMLKVEDYKFKTFLKTRNIVSELEELSNQMKELAECKKDEQEDKYKKANETFDSFIQKIDNLNA